MRQLVERCDLKLAVRAVAWIALIGLTAAVARRLDWDGIGWAFLDASPWLLLAGVVVGVPASVVQAARWAAIVRAVGPVPFGTVLAALNLGYSANALLPLKAGEAVRLELVARASRLPRTTVLGTVAADVGMNAATLFLFASMLPLLLPVPGATRVVVWTGVMLVLVGAGALVWWANRPDEGRSPGRLGALLIRVREGFAAFRDSRVLAQSFAAACASWVIELAATMLALRAFGLPADVGTALAVLVGVNLALAIPSPPANLGTFEVGAAFALVAFAGVPTERAAAFAVGYHLIQVLPTLICGGVFLPRFRTAQREARLELGSLRGAAASA